MNRIISMKKFAILFMLLILLISGLNTVANSEEITIGISVMDTFEPFYVLLNDGFTDGAKELGVKIILASAGLDLATQISQIENFIALGVDAIILIPTDSAGIVPAVKLANNAGIPLLTADIKSEGGEVFCHVASDNYQMGVLAAEYVGERMKGKGKAAIYVNAEWESEFNRSEGFKKTIEEKYSGIEIIRVLALGIERGKASDGTEDILAAFPKNPGEEIAIWSTSGGECGIGAYLAIKAAQRDDVFVVNTDGISDSREIIYNGNSILVADVVQFPHIMGVESIKAVVDYLSGKSIPKSLPVPIKLITAKDLVKKGDEILIKGIEVD